VRGRLGLAADRTLFYLTAGGAIGEVANTALYNSTKFPTSNTPSFNIDSTRVGWVAGSGLEQRFNTSVAIVRAGLNYKFDWFGPRI